jgi:hypothetical protein
MEISQETTLWVLGAGGVVTFTLLGITLRVLLVEVWPVLKGRMEAEGEAKRAAVIDQYVKKAVMYAEQVIGQGQGEKKKRLAVRMAQKWLDAHQIPLDAAEIDAQIEAAVYEYLTDVLVEQFGGRGDG